VDVRLLYGTKGLRLNLPDDWEIEIVRKRSMPVLPDPTEALARAVEQPVGAPALERQARGCRTACILVSDVTRPVPNGLVLPVLVRTLLGAGIEAGRITGCFTAWSCPTTRPGGTRITSWWV
jgi:nickel-dependent lactate racemase